MSTYLLVKLAHVISACVLLGTGAGIAFFMLLAHRSRDPATFAAVSRMVVRADWIFTAPAVVVQLGTGLWLTQALSVPWGSRWFLSVLGLFVFVGACWLPVLWIQHRLAALPPAAYGSPPYRRLMRAWTGLGIPAFSAVLLILYLMLSKSGMGEMWWYW